MFIPMYIASCGKVGRSLTASSPYLAGCGLVACQGRVFLSPDEHASDRRQH
ncbi:hypothetical protein [Desulfonema magnum]|uniref:hypothetical protein n=1 Tax=Desulfonema magnum TaxID=45655 RepID=UPI001A9AC178|nr:hypothetical protein [Desulfonema magnum]